MKYDRFLHLCSIFYCLHRIVHEDTNCVFVYICKYVVVLGFRSRSAQPSFQAHEHKIRAMRASHHKTSLLLFLNPCKVNDIRIFSKNSSLEKYSLKCFHLLLKLQVRLKQRTISSNLLSPISPLYNPSLSFPAQCDYYCAAQ